MHRYVKFLLFSALAFSMFSVAASPARAQFSDELKELLLDIKSEFDADIQKKIDKAIADKTDRIKFTTDEFERFRSNPVNPFDGLEAIDTRTLRGGIELKFEIPTVRNRQVGIYERQNPETLRQLSEVISRSATAVVEILADDQVICLGTVIDSKGTVMTKWSEVDGKKNLKIRDFQRVQFAATVKRNDQDDDLALLETQATHLNPIEFADRQPNMGDFVITAGLNNKVLALGSYSHAPRSLAESEKGFLGVTPRTVQQGVELTEVSPGSAAASAGLQVGDVIIKANGSEVVDVTNLVAAVQRSKAGDQMKIEYNRNGARLEVVVTLAGRSLSSDRAARFKMMNRLGAIPSERANDFPWVFQHDSPLFPEQCGGPIFDLQGNCLGINIARQGRVSSLAIPTAHLKTAINKLQRETIASRD